MVLVLVPVLDIAVSVVQLSVGGRVGLLPSLPRSGDRLIALGKQGAKVWEPEIRRRGFLAGGSSGIEELDLLRMLVLRPVIDPMLLVMPEVDRRDEAKRGLMVLLLARLRMNDCLFSANGRASDTLSVWLTMRMLRRFSASVKERRFSASVRKTEGMSCELRFDTGGLRESRLVPRVERDPLLLLSCSMVNTLFILLFRFGR